MNAVAPLPASARRWAWWPVVALPALMALLDATVEPTVFYDPPWLILLGNTVFIGLVDFLVAGIAWRNYRSSGQPQVLLLGCAMAVFGLGAVLAAWARSLPDGANGNVTIYNSAVLMAAVLHAAAGLLLAADLGAETPAGRRIRWLAVGYGASLLFAAALALAAVRGALPVFFVQGVGATALRQWVLGGATVLLAFAALVFLATGRRSGEPFLFWYAGALALTAIGLVGFFIQRSVGSPVGWTGRVAQYLGGMYFLAALLSMGRQAHRQGTSLDGALTASLAGAEERFRATFANASIGFAMTSPAGLLLTANPVFCQLTGYALEELRGKPFAELVHPEDRAANLAQQACMMAGDIADFTLENRYLRKDGRVVWVRKTVSLARNAHGTPHWIVVLIEDITRRRQAEEALRATSGSLERLLGEVRRDEAMLEAMFAAQLDVVLVFDETMRVRRVNPVFQEAYGFDPVGLGIRELMARVDCRHLDGTPAALGQPLPTPQALGGQAARGFRFLVRRADGSEGCVETSSGPLQVGGGVGGVVTVWHDITDQRRVEAELREANRHKDEFLATLAHELRNPLAPIRTAAHLLAMRASEDPELRQLHELIGRQAAHMARLVDDLLDVSRIERGKLTLQTRRLDFGEAVARTLAASRGQVEERQHQLDLDLPAEPVEVEADPARVDQMVANLVTNACKYTPPGGRIQVAACREGDEAVLRVRDNGVGMTAEALGHVFDLFYQVGQTLDRPDGGLGIGLTLVDRLARLHQGSIAAASPGPGLGSEFTLRLPAAAPRAAGRDPEPPGRVPFRIQAGRPRHVLVVDDNEGVVATTRMLLESLGLRVSTAGTGEAGLRRARTLVPDLALVDLGLPGLNGYEVARQLRAERGPSIRLIALSGYSREADIRAAMDAGFDTYLVKSADPNDLIAGLASYLA
jgi:two-component system CheB/CheR fusion protein